MILPCEKVGRRRGFERSTRVHRTRVLFLCLLGTRNSRCRLAGGRELAAQDFARATEAYRKRVGRPAADEEDGIPDRKAQSVPAMEPGPGVEPSSTVPPDALSAVQMSGEYDVIVRRGDLDDPRVVTDEGAHAARIAPHSSPHPRLSLIHI